MKKLVILLTLALCGVNNGYAAFDSGRTAISISINNEVYPYRNFASYVLPEEHLGMCLVTEQPERYRVIAASGLLDFIADCRWLRTAPAAPGLSSIRVSEGDDEVMSINVFVMTPVSQFRNGRIGAVEIGTCPQPIDDSAIYQRPDGFIVVNEDTLARRVSPHFVLGQFVTALDRSYPQYIVLRERLLLKLEVIMERLNEKGLETESLGILKGYVSPAYNASIGGLPDSRHMYGGAATIIVDRDGDGRMDDLAGNGVLNDRDGQVLFELVDELFSEPGREYLRGGLFLYRGDVQQGSSVMVDSRGFRKRWLNDSEVPPLPDNLSAKHKRQFP